MTRRLLVSSMAFAIGVAATAAFQSPAHACSGKVAEGFPNAAFQNSGTGSFSLGGGATDGPRHGFGGSHVIPSEAGAHANGNSVVEQRSVDAQNGQSLVRIGTKCADEPS